MCFGSRAWEPSDFPGVLCSLLVLRRIEVTFLDTVVRIEHRPSGAQEGSVALEVHIKK